MTVSWRGDMQVEVRQDAVVEASEQGDSTETARQQRGAADQEDEAVAVEGSSSKGHDASEL